MESFGHFLRYVRKIKGLTQEQVAEKLNIVTPVLSRWENDKSVPSLDIVCKLCNILDISIEECVAKEKSGQESVLPPEEYNATKLGETIKDLRVKNGWSQGEVAKALFVTSQTVSRWESGGISSLEILDKLAELFGLTPTQLLYGLEQLQPIPNKTAAAERSHKSKRVIIKITAIILAGLIAIGAVAGIIIGVLIKNKDKEDLNEYENNSPVEKDEGKQQGLSFICPLTNYSSYDTFSYDPLDAMYYYCLTFATEVGAEIIAMEDGAVESFSDTQLCIKHPNGFKSYYFFVDILDLQIGDEVKKGQTIAKVSSAYDDYESALLHIRMWLNGDVIDPLDYITDLK